LNGLLLDTFFSNLAVGDCIKFSCTYLYYYFFRVGWNSKLLFFATRDFVIDAAVSETRANIHLPPLFYFETQATPIIFNDAVVLTTELYDGCLCPTANAAPYDLVNQLTTSRDTGLMFEKKIFSGLVVYEELRELSLTMFWNIADFITGELSVQIQQFLEDFVVVETKRVGGTFQRIRRSAFKTSATAWIVASTVKSPVLLLTHYYYMCVSRVDCQILTTRVIAFQKFFLLFFLKFLLYAGLFFRDTSCLRFKIYARTVSNFLNVTGHISFCRFFAYGLLLNFMHQCQVTQSSPNLRIYKNSGKI
jgi:hypothetical protein